ncbi:ATP-binding cassette domain-containing protein [Haematospirillum sp. H1815]|nr:ATP-binding cassette domain-containing protein [Haematospirillum sp. H1815]
MAVDLTLRSLWTQTTACANLRSGPHGTKDRVCVTYLPRGQDKKSVNAADERGGSAIRFECVGLRYGNGPEVLQDISFNLPPGSFHFLCGPSGAGKTSLLSLLYLARRPSRGRLSLFDIDVGAISRKDLPALRRRIGVVFQEFRLMDHLSTLDNVALPLRVAGVSEASIQRHVPELLEWVGLEKYMHTKPAILSGGQKQRVAIARAVINRPDILVADEATGNVDAETATRLMHLFMELNRLGTTIVMATHNEELLRRFPAPCLMLQDGHVSISESPATAFMPGGEPVL